MNSLTLLAIVVLAGLATAYPTPESNARIQQYPSGRYESETLEQQYPSGRYESETLKQLLNTLMAKKQLQEMKTANAMADNQENSDQLTAIAQNPHAIWCIWVPEPVRKTLPVCQGTAPNG